jgi:3-dehydroquinate synthase
MHVIEIKSRVRDYTVSFSDSADFINGLASKTDSIFVIDSNVWNRHANGCLKPLAQSDIMVFPVSEDRKNLESVEELYGRFMERAAKKNMTLITVGGGILQDITGFAATTLYRGINWIFVPTTLLAQADSCIGSKTSLNHKRFKNLLGTFFPPSEVHVHAPFLQTLKDVDFFSGLGEVVKLHIMGGRERANELSVALPRVLKREPEVLMTAVRNSLSVKLSYMEGDEFDRGRRNLLNFGHCFGHAFETAGNYSVPHGQAVVLGMIFADIASRRRKLLTAATEDLLLRELLLPTVVTRGAAGDYAAPAILEAMKKDKKRTGQGLALVLMKEDYSFVKADDFGEDEFRTALDELKAILHIV